MSNNSVSDLMSNSGAVACAGEINDLAQCLAERLTQKNEDETTSLKKRYKSEDDIIGIALHLQVKQQQQSIPLSCVLMQLTNPEGVMTKQSIDIASELSVAVCKSSEPEPPIFENKSHGKAEGIAGVRNKVKDDFATADYSALQSGYIRDVSKMSSMSALASTSASLTPLTEITSRPHQKSQDEKSEKFTEIITHTPRITIADHSQTISAPENQKNVGFASQAMHIPSVLKHHEEGDLSPAIITKSLNLDLQADKVELHYPITDRAVVKLQLTEQAIAPASSNVRVSEMLVGQAALSNYDPGWLLHGIKQARPYYLSLAGNEQRGKTENDVWKDREE